MNKYFYFESISNCQEISLKMSYIVQKKEVNGLFNENISYHYWPYFINYYFGLGCADAGLQLL